MKIMKQKKKSGDGSDEEAPDMRSFDSSQKGGTQGRKQASSLQKRPTMSRPVMEAKEEEEFSPKYRLGQKELAKKASEQQ